MYQFWSEVNTFLERRKGQGGLESWSGLLSRREEPCVMFWNVSNVDLNPPLPLWASILDLSFKLFTSTQIKISTLQVICIWKLVLCSSVGSTSGSHLSPLNSPLPPAPHLRNTTHHL